MYFIYLISFMIAAVLLYLIVKREREKNFRLTRVYYEDALKFIYHRIESGSRATVESLKGYLSLSAGKVMKLVDLLEEMDLVELRHGGIELLEKGRTLVLEIIRAHRLWETYLQHETDVPIHKIHKYADNEEHHLRGERLEALNAHLGFPAFDPHGDPIPTREGELAQLDAEFLSDWPIGEEALISHIEDEPVELSKKLFKLGLRVDTKIKILDRKKRELDVLYQDKKITLDMFSANNIQVKKHPDGEIAAYDTLDELAESESAFIAGISNNLQGLARRRLLDLGITPGVRISSVLRSSFGGDPTAYFVRGAKIALRREQAKDIYIERL